MNASVATGIPAAEYGRRFDTVTLCLSKGLGCPLGALLATSSELAWHARARQASDGRRDAAGGIVAAAGVYALDNNVERLADDHARARRLARRWTRRACRSTSSRSRRTSSRSTSGRSA